MDIHPVINLMPFNTELYMILLQMYKSPQLIPYVCLLAGHDVLHSLSKTHTPIYDKKARKYHIYRLYQAPPGGLEPPTS